MSGWLVAALTAAVLAFVLLRARWWPYGRCWACRGRKRGVASTTRAFSKCHWCQGLGVQIRLPARIYPKWRRVAQQAKAARTDPNRT